jgi:hypothetical protein
MLRPYIFVFTICWEWRSEKKVLHHFPQSCTCTLIDMRLSPAHTAPTITSSKQELVEPIVIILAT